MEHKTHNKPAAKRRQLTLPVTISSPLEVGRLISELTNLDETLRQLELRGSGHEIKLPRTTRLMDKLAEANKLNLLKSADRDVLLKFLSLVHDKAPVLKISLNVDPSPAFLEPLTTWLRQEIHPQILINVGLQPNLGAGCIVYGGSKVFDFSLRQTFIKQRQLLLKMLMARPAPAKAAEADQ